MLGVLYPGRGKFKIERVSVLGLPVLWANVPVGGFWETRRAARAERSLYRNGVRRLLPVQAATRWKVSLPVVELLPLYRALADRMVLEVLKGRGVEARDASVALAGERVDADLARAAYLLCPKIRTLLLEVGDGGERLAMELYRTFGAAVRTEGRADLTVRFGGESRGGEMVLCGRPELLGVTVELPGFSVPEALEPMPFLTALWQTGRVNVKDFRLR